MKSAPIIHLLAALFASALPASPLQKAEVTRVYNDVKLLPGQSESREAQPGDVIEGKTAVRTGEKSRAELKFTDATLTRLGANTQFSFESGTRNLSLENGVIFLQVPKGAGGAKIRTAAVTAAITGTTIMMEYVNGKALKIIVIEGTLDVYFPDRPGVFITLKAGQMIMMRPDARGFPRPVEVDLEALLKTSDLAGGRFFDPVGGDAAQAIVDAVDGQNNDLKKGKLIGTNLVIPGRGNQVLVLTGDSALALRQNEPFLTQGTPPGQTPSASSNPTRNLPRGLQFLPPPQLAGNWVMDSAMRINPALAGPDVRQPSRLGRGSIYLPGATGSLHPWLFGTLETIPGNDLSDLLDGTGAWSVYLLENLTLAGTPLVVPFGTANLMFASPNPISSLEFTGVGPAPTWDLSSARNWAIMTQDSPITLAGWGFQVAGTNSDLLLHANGLNSDVTVLSSMELGEGSLITRAGRDTTYDDGISLVGSSWSVDTAGKLLVNRTTATMSGSMELQAGGDVEINHSALVADATITVQDSNQLATLIDGTGPRGNILVRSTNGNVILCGQTTLRGTGPSARVDVVAVNGRIDTSADGSGPERVNIEATEIVRFEATGGANPGIRLDDTSILGNEVILQANGTNSVLEIIDSDVLSRTSARLYADGPGSVLRFGGMVRISGDTVRLAGQTVNVLPNGTVDATMVQTLGIHADQHYYYLNNATNSAYGVILTNPSGSVIQTNYEGRNLPLPPPNNN